MINEFGGNDFGGDVHFRKFSFSISNIFYKYEADIEKKSCKITRLK